MKDKKRLPKRIIALIVAGVFIAAIGLTALGFFIAFWVADGNAYVWRPDYEMLPASELKAVYDKEELTDSDYQILFEQTGLTRVGIDRAKKKGDYGWSRVKEIQRLYFVERKVRADMFVPLVCTDYFDGDPGEFIFLERGDIIISSSTHFSGFRIGHAAIVTNGGSYRIFQSNQVGVANGYANAYEMYSTRLNYMVLRIKPEYFAEVSEDGTLDEDSYTRNLDRVTEYIETQFKDVKYSVVTGVFTKKDSKKSTNCSHMIWYGFKHFDDDNGGKFNLNLDSNGGILAMPKDITKSPYVELVQTFGFNPDKMYE